MRILMFAFVGVVASPLLLLAIAYGLAFPWWTFGIVALLIALPIGYFIWSFIAAMAPRELREAARARTLHDAARRDWAVLKHGYTVGDAINAAAPPLTGRRRIQVDQSGSHSDEPSPTGGPNYTKLHG